MQLKYPCDKVWPPVLLSYYSSVIGVLISLVTVTGNFLIFLTFVKDPLKQLRTPFMFLLVNSAVSDFLVGLISMPVATYAHILEIFRKESKFTEARIIGHLQFYVFLSYSTLSFAALSLERYLAVNTPIIYRQKVTIKKCLYISALIWVLSISIPTLYLKVGHRNFHLIFVHYSLTVTLGVLAFTFYRVRKRLRSTKRNLNRINRIQVLTRSQHENQRRSNTVEDNNNSFQTVSRKRLSLREEKCLQILLNILCLYTILYLPVLIISYMGEFASDLRCDVRHVLRDHVFLLTAATSAINPFVCTFRLTSFKEACKCILSRNYKTRTAGNLLKQRISEFEDFSLRRTRSRTSISEIENFSSRKPRSITLETVM